MAGAHVINVGEQTFQRDVIEASNQIPVMVVFWSASSAPSQTVGTDLEKLAEEFGGALRVAKVDFDVEQQLAGMFRVQAAPAVFAVFQGQPFDGFQDALSAGEIRKFVEGAFERLGLPIPDSGVAPTDPAAAYAYWHAKFSKNETDGEARLNLSRLDVAAGRVDAGRAHLEAITATQPEYSAAQAALATLGLAAAVLEAGGEEAVRALLAATPDDPRLRYLVACAEASKGQLVAALTELVELVRGGNADVQADVRKAASIVFEAAGRLDPEVEALRRKLALLLF